jgi:hypothetical protein
MTDASTIAQMTDDVLRWQYNANTADQALKQAQYMAWAYATMQRGFDLAAEMDKRGLKP